MGPSRLTLATLMLLATLWWPAPGSASDGRQDDAVHFVQTLSNDAIAILSNPVTSDAERRRRYRRLLEQSFAVSTIGRFVIGRYWRAATPDQRSEYLALFREFVLETYSSQIDEFVAGSFRVIKSKPIDRHDTIVSTEVVSSGGRPPVHIDYRVREKGNAYRIVDVIVEGVSLITTQRSEFKSVIARKGVDGLIELLRNHTARSAAAD